MLSCSGFSDNARLLHPPGQKPLPDRVIDLVSSGMTEVFALQIDLRSTQSLRESLRKVERCGTSGILLQIIGELGLETLVLFHQGIFLLQFKQGGHECFRNIASAIGAEPTLFIRHRCHHHPHFRTAWRDGDGSRFEAF
ncbi:MAG: hypothetical protein JW395_0290 [Nitrospira sp.]|nr:hypothetical protein [Nitrospira sp.]